MTTLNEVTRKALRNRIDAANREVPESIKKMLDDAESGKDFILRLGEGMTTEFSSNAGIRMATPIGGFTLHNNAITQLSGKYGISKRELDKYINHTFPGGPEWQDRLIATMLNEHASHAKQQRFLIRAVGNEVRGILGEGYKIYDNQILMTQFIRSASEAGAIFAGGHYNGLKVWLEMINPNTISFDTQNNGTVEIAYGVRTENSEFGVGAYKLGGFFMNAWCANGAMSKSSINERHVGERLPEGFEFSRETLMANSKSKQLIIRDIVTSLMDENYVRRYIIQIQEASAIKVDIKKELEKLQLAGLTKTEIEETEVILMENKKTDGVQGKNTLWKLTQAITAAGRNKTEERKRELQELVGEMLPQVTDPVLFVN